MTIQNITWGNELRPNSATNTSKIIEVVDAVNTLDSDMGTAQNDIDDLQTDVSSLKDEVFITQMSINCANIPLMKVDTTKVTLSFQKSPSFNPTNVVSDVNTVSLMDMVTATNATGIDLDAIAITDRGSIGIVTFTLGTNTIPNNHMLRFSGTAPTITIS